MIPEPWDYLILTASNEAQAAAYRSQLALRERLGLLGGVRHWLVVPDPGGRRVGSGGSTIACLIEVLNHRLAGRGESSTSAPTESLSGPHAWLEILRGLRILVIHAGGDSRRLPAYGPCGKVFVPLPGTSDSALGSTLFDRQLPIYLRLPAGEREKGTGPICRNGPEGASHKLDLSPFPRGQVVITAGDVFLGFAPEEVVLAPAGITGVGCAALPEEASRHGVYCPGPGGQVRRFLQKPTPAEQAAAGALDAYGHAVLDVGAIHFDAVVAVQLLELFEVHPGADGRLAWSGPMGEAIDRLALDFYREICCALGSDCTLTSYHAALRASGSLWPEPLAEQIYAAVSAFCCSMHVLKRCDFLHFGTTRQIITSGLDLLRRESRLATPPSVVSINNRLATGGLLKGENAWVEGCSINSPLTLAGNNVVAGVDVDQPLELPPGACLDVIPGRNRAGEPVHFVRCYQVDDVSSPGDTPTLSGWPLECWLQSAGAGPEMIWDEAVPPDRRTTWNARLFPAEPGKAQGLQPLGLGACRVGWLWMFDPTCASPAQFHQWLMADRYSLEEMATLADQEAFHRRRASLRSAEILASLKQCFRPESGFSAADLAHLLAREVWPGRWLAEVLAEARRYWDAPATASPEEAFIFSRIIHSLGSAVLSWAEDSHVGRRFPLLDAELGPDVIGWLRERQVAPSADVPESRWAERAQALAFEFLRRRIVASGEPACPRPTNALRSDEIVWGRAPARIDLTGGWTDTPPFSLEHGGCVLNAAVELNGQPPIQVYARVTPERLIRCRSIDVGTQVEIRRWEDLLDYAQPTSAFSLVKAALAHASFSPAGEETLEEFLKRFGGGLEVSTLAAIPKGSGLGTSSIMGAVLMAVIHRVVGRPLAPDALFHAVLRLEQALTTGGGWQDQIGGSVGGLKLITTRPGLVPQATIRYVPADILDPASNDGQTLLYYTGITRLAKNILEEVVGRYLDRDRQVVATLANLRTLAQEMTEAVARKDLPAFGRMIAAAWQLNKQMDPHSTNAEIEDLLSRVAPHLWGAKLLGAGGGGFLLMVARSRPDADRIRSLLAKDPLNPRSRFFEFSVAAIGLAVSVC